MTSNYASHQVAGTKPVKHGSSGANYAQNSHLQQEMYHMGSLQGNLAVQGATKSKMSHGSAKQTIAISGTSKRKTSGLDS